jgi:hypothetical protein
MIFDQAINLQALAVVLYSITSTSCNLTNYSGSYSNIFTTDNAGDAASLLAAVIPNAVIHADLSRIPGNSSPNGNGGSGAMMIPPNTNIAMIILYSITGLVTALFLAIIVTGAIRAHRNPERYGPRNVTGRPRQSRARGLAKAMLDTLPIIKVGERQENAKPTDVEMVEGTHGPVEMLPASGSSQTNCQASHFETAAEGVIGGKQTSLNIAGREEAAAASVTQQSPELPESQGCSICTDEFELGQDQRVLPCDHRFHPACIDPWLLNVSGTCPLCRIDLRPKDQRDELEVDDPDRGGAGFAPPLNPAEEGQRNWRASLRHRILLGTGREDRLNALRELRRGNPAGPRTDTHPSQDEESESNIRRRLRNTLRVRTRRIGEADQEHVETSPPRENVSGPSRPA